jgi:hypothetical protein
LSVVANTHWGLTPRESIEAECKRRGREAVVAGCVALVRGDDVDPPLLVALAGPAADKFLDGRQHDDVYWLRVWGIRGLLYAWDDSAAGAVQRALGDESWRVREMACKVAARRQLGDALASVAELREDPVARVRAAASRAVTTLTEAGA